jgi:N-acetylmuramoyl-L-alanine amidase
MSGWYTVKSGDCINSIAFENGLFWQTVWNDPNNQNLRGQRKNPNILLAGDLVFVPDLRPRIELRPTDNRHTFVRKGVPAKIRLCLMANKQPRANVPYTLTIDGQTFNGTTGPDGKIAHSIAPNAKSGKVILTHNGVTQVRDLNLGYIDPITEPSGVQQRLVNLGYECDIGDDLTSPKMQNVLQAFQADRKLPVTGELDDATRMQIQQAHGN